MTSSKECSELWECWDLLMDTLGVLGPSVPGGPGLGSCVLRHGTDEVGEELCPRHTGTVSETTAPRQGSVVRFKPEHVSARSVLQLERGPDVCY